MVIIIVVTVIFNVIIAKLYQPFGKMREYTIGKYTLNVCCCGETKLLPENHWWLAMRILVLYLLEPIIVIIKLRANEASL